MTDESFSRAASHAGEMDEEAPGEVSRDGIDCPAWPTAKIERRQTAALPEMQLLPKWQSQIRTIGQ